MISVSQTRFEASARALLGVLISVTTIPAAANAAVALAYGVTEQSVGALIQLVVNLAAITVGGVTTLVVQRVNQRRRAAQATAGG